MTTTSKGRGSGGAAQAAPSTPQEAEKLLLKATSPEEAWRIYEIAAGREEDWRVVKLKAERRAGELLGPATAKPGPGRGKKSVTSSNALGAERVAANRARKVAAVPDEKFNEYIEQNGAKSTREGLLREHGPKPKPKPKQRTSDSSPLWQDEQVLSWLSKRVKAGRLRDEVLAEAKAGKYGWPLPGRHLTQAAYDRGRAILEDRKQQTRPKKGPTVVGKRANQIRKKIEEARKTGESLKFWEIGWSAVQLMSNLTRWNIEEAELSESSMDVIDAVHTDLLYTLDWVRTKIAQIETRYSEQDKIRKIKALRSKTVANGCTVEEEESSQAAADEMQRRLENVLAA